MYQLIFLTFVLMKIKIFILLLLTGSFSHSQEIQTELVSKTPLHADSFIGVDELNHIYFIKNNVLFKKRNLDTINYSNISLGKITSVNIQNPFKLIVFYKEFNSVVVLDNNLNELTNRIDFTKETLFNNVQFVSVSSENDLWLYADDTKLYLYDYKKHSIKVETQPMSFYHNSLNANQIKSNYKNVWLLSEKGVIQFNEYGNYIQFINIENITDIFPLKKDFIYSKNSSFFFWENEKSIPISLNYTQTIKNININNSSMYIFDGKDIYQYTLKY